MDDPRPRMIVGVGASAGGLAAFEAFLKGIPTNAGFGYVLVQHLDPNHQSELSDLLQTTTGLVVQTVEDAMPVRPNHIYVIPPGSILEIEEGVLHLRSSSSSNRRRMPIDLFLRSLAKDQGARSACVILSGTGSDGSSGLKAVKEAGGACIVQAPDDAEYDGMPRAAIATGLVDVVATARECGAKLAAFVDPDRLPAVVAPSQAKAQQEDYEQLAEIFRLLESRSGHDFSAYKTTTIWRRISHRMQLRQLADLSEYVRVLEKDPTECRALTRDFLISVTNFFRDREAFEVLNRVVIPRILDSRPEDEPIRVWVPGCATGEEAYSLLMLFHEQMDRRDESDRRIQMFATDIDEQALNVARAAFYPESITTDVSRDRLDRFFIHENGGFRVHNRLRENTLFAAHNLLHDPPFSRLDLISCRNLMIYLKREVQERIMQLFHYALNPQGYLFLGRSETPTKLGTLFETVDKPAHLYRARDIERDYPHLPLKHLDPELRRSLPAKRQDDRPSIPTLHRNAAIARHLPPTLLVDQNFDVVHVIGEVGEYMRIGPGTPSNEVLSLAHPALRTELRAALYSVFNQGERTELKNVVLSSTSPADVVNVVVEPVDVPESDAPYALVTFIEQEPIETVDREAASKDASDLVTQRLEQELDGTRNRLQVITEQYETSNEELLASNEELQSMNEELRSTMEELETSKEELQSTNEELLTVNHELQAKVEALNQMNSDMKNLMEATDIPTVFLDTDLNVKRFTPSATRVFNIIASDEGRPFAHVSHNLTYAGCTGDAQAVLEHLTPLKKEVEGQNGHWYQMRVLPYRTLDNRIDGVVLTFVDVTALKEAEARVEQINDELEARVEQRTKDLREMNRKLEEEVADRERAETHFHRLFRLAPVAGFIIEAETPTIIEVNDRFLNVIGWKADDLVGADLCESGILAEPVWKALTGSLQGNRLLQNQEVEMRTASGETISVMLSSAKLEREGAPSILAFGVDITERKKTEAMLRQAKEQAEAMNRLKTSFIANMSHEIRTPLTGVIGFADILDEVVSEENRPFVSYIRANGKRLLDTLESVMDLARLDANEITLHPTAVDLVAFLEETVDLFRIHAKDKELSMDVQVPEAAQWVNVDTGALQRVLNNLLSNALKFTEKGRVTVRLSLDESRPMPVRIQVEDTGIGMSAAFLENVFQEFKQESSGMSRAYEGVGLGLSITHRLVSMMNGSIDIESEKGEGTTVTIELPLRLLPEQKAPDAAEDREASVFPAADMPKPHVLVVDDRPEIGMMVKQFLEDCAVTVVEDPEELNENLNGYRDVDIAFVDIQLRSSLGGVDVMNLLRSGAGRKKIPVVALTAHSLPRDRHRFLEQGFDEYISKPFSAARLRTVLRSLLSPGVVRPD